MYKCKICGKTVKSPEFGAKEDRAVVHLERCHAPDLANYLECLEIKGNVQKVIGRFYIELDE